MPDLRRDRKSSRQGELSAFKQATETGKKRAAPTDELDHALSGLAKDAPGKKAFKGAKLDARSQIRTATATAGTLIMRLDAAFAAYTDACDIAAQARTRAEKKKTAAKAESKRVQLAELRRTINVMGPLAAMLLKAGKLTHDGDFDRLLKQVKIEGTGHFDRQCEGE